MYRGFFLHVCSNTWWRQTSVEGLPLPSPHSIFASQNAAYYTKGVSRQQHQSVSVNRIFRCLLIAQSRVIQSLPPHHRRLMASRACARCFRSSDMSGHLDMREKAHRDMRMRTDDLENGIPARLVEALDLLLRHAAHLLFELSTNASKRDRKKVRAHVSCGHGSRATRTRLPNSPQPGRASLPPA